MCVSSKRWRTPYIGGILNSNRGMGVSGGVAEALDDIATQPVEVALRCPGPVPFSEALSDESLLAGNVQLNRSHRLGSDWD
jgi:hypothetical protein